MICKLDLEAERQVVPIAQELLVALSWQGLILTHLISSYSLLFLHTLKLQAICFLLFSLQNYSWVIITVHICGVCVVIMCIQKCNDQICAISTPTPSNIYYCFLERAFKIQSWGCSNRSAIESVPWALRAQNSIPDTHTRRRTSAQNSSYRGANIIHLDSADRHLHSCDTRRHT